MKGIMILIFLFLVPICFAELDGLPNNSDPGLTQPLHSKSIGGINPVENNTYYQIGPYGETDSGISSGCANELDAFFGQEPKELVQQYCSNVGFRIIIIFIIVGLLWLFEPKVRAEVMKRDFDNGFISSAQIMHIYKWLGLGILFIGIYGLIIL